MITERQMLHGMPYSGQRISGWLMSEKRNGCRAYWDGARMWTRTGREIVLPEHILGALPEGIALDGEINAGPYPIGFETARRAVQYGRFSPACIYSVFDAPDQGAAFIERYSFLQYILPAAGPVHYIEHLICRDISDAVRMMRSLQAVGGEGVILRHPGNRYSPGRTEEILKLKRVPDGIHPLSALR